eukprot:2519777-Pleurochrysis_carterae.AAC.1
MANLACPQEEVVRQQRCRPVEPALLRAPSRSRLRRRAEVRRAKGPAQPPGARRRVLLAHAF